MAEIVEFLIALPCDDVRREDNGKDIIIGVYGDTIVVANFPAPLVLTFWVQFRATELTEAHPFSFRLIGDGDLKFAEMSGGMKTVRIGIGSFAVGPIPLQFQVPTKLKFQAKQANGDWQTLREVEVVKGQITAVLPVRGGIGDVVDRQKIA